MLGMQLTLPQFQDTNCAGSCLRRSRRMNKANCSAERLQISNFIGAMRIAERDTCLDIRLQLFTTLHLFRRVGRSRV